MATFKVKYRTRNKLQRAIQQEIRKLGLVDTRAMMDSIRISSVAGDLNQIEITVNALYYYFFLDNGTDEIAPQNITAKALRSPKGQQFLEEVVQAYMEFLTEEYPILEVAKLKINPNATLNYQLFGDPSGKWNGTFEETIKINVR